MQRRHLGREHSREREQLVHDPETAVKLCLQGAVRPPLWPEKWWNRGQGGATGLVEPGPLLQDGQEQQISLLSRGEDPRVPGALWL